MDSFYIIIFPLACCIPFALFYAYQKMVIQNKIRNVAYLFTGMLLGGLTVIGMQLPTLIENPSFNSMMNQLLEVSNSGNINNNNNTNVNSSSDEDEDDNTDDDDDNTENNNNNNNNQNNQNNRRVYETTFTIPIDQNNIFNELFNNQFSSMLNQARQRRTAATSTRRTRFPTTPPSNINNNNTPITPNDNNDLNNTD